MFMDLALSQIEPKTRLCQMALKSQASTFMAYKQGLQKSNRLAFDPPNPTRAKIGYVTGHVFLTRQKRKVRLGITYSTPSNSFWPLNLISKNQGQNSYYKIRKIESWKPSLSTPTHPTSFYFSCPLAVFIVFMVRRLSRPCCLLDVMVSAI